MFVDNTALDIAIRAAALSCAAMLWLVLLIRINGLRSLSKMTNFDFVMTIALGSLLAGAGQASEWNAFVQALLAMVALFGLQWTLAKMRRVAPQFQWLIQNRPVILMRDGKIIDAALRLTRVDESDLMAKLRKANAVDFDKIRAVVLETTGDVSVIYGETADERLCAGLDMSGGKTRFENF